MSAGFNTKPDLRIMFKEKFGKPIDSMKRVYKYIQFIEREWYKQIKDNEKLKKQLLN